MQEFHNYDEKVDSNDTLVSHTEDFPETQHQKARDQTLAVIQLYIRCDLL